MAYRVISTAWSQLNIRLKTHTATLILHGTSITISKFSSANLLGSNAGTPMRISDMGLSGQFPRGIRNCTSLTGLDLSSNKLSGPLPFDIEWLVSFDRNHLTGEIPSELGHLVRMKQFSVANNMLSGVVPYFGPNVSITADSFVTTWNFVDRLWNPVQLQSKEGSSIFHSKVGFKLVMRFLQFQ